MGEFVELDVPVAEINRFLPMAAAVTPQQVQTYAATRLAPADINILVVGDARVLVQALHQQYPALELIPATELDLENPTLRRSPAK